MDRVRKKLHAEEVHKKGFTGTGVTVAVLDSGICIHPDYAERIVEFRDFVHGKKECYDDASHGTHVSGILCSDGKSSHGKYRGIAPGCRLIHLKVLDRYGHGKLENILRALDWVIQNQKQYSIRILNLSAGSSKGELDEKSVELVKKVEQVWDAGIIVVVAAGNMGPVSGSITVPGNSRKVITVGSSDQFIYKPVTGAQNYSGCGPTIDCICKPELVAPGTEIISCSPYLKTGRYYSKKSGTSMAAPSVSGCIALLLEQEPDLSNVAVKIRLKESTVNLGYPINRQGWGIPDLRKLLHIT